MRLSLDETVSVAHALAALLEDQAHLGLEGVPHRLLVARANTVPVAASASASQPTSAPASALSKTPAAAQAQATAPAPARSEAPTKASRLEPAPATVALVARSVPIVNKGIDSEELKAIREELGDCARCKLCKGRTNIVFGVGNPKARLVFVGEGPGQDEDLQGEPFVGKAGQLLTKMIEAMKLSRDEVYIANVVKCRPPNNRDPEPDEVAACEPFLIRQLEAIEPEVVVALGKHAAHTLLREKTPITKMRGQWKTYQGLKLMPTYHPAYLLRNPAEKRAAWADLQEVMRTLGLS